MTASIKALTIIAAISAALVFASTADALPYNLGGAADYAVLSIGGVNHGWGVTTISTEEIYQSGTVINGNVGIGPNTNVTHHMDAHINGRLDYDSTVTATSNFLDHPYVDNISGGAHQTPMSSIVADARNASLLYAGLAATQTFSTWNQNGQTINLNPGLNVIRVTGDVTLKQDFVLNGSATSMVVFQFTSGTGAGHDVLTLSGTNMILMGGISASQILWDLDGAGGDVSITSDANLYGTFLAPDRNFLMDSAALLGQIIAGGDGSYLSIHSTSTVTMPGGQVPDGGSGLMLLGFALGGLKGLHRFLGWRS